MHGRIAARRMRAEQICIETEDDLGVVEHQLLQGLPKAACAPANT
jgi:hypothetical protein